MAMYTTGSKRPWDADAMVNNQRSHQDSDEVSGLDDESGPQSEEQDSSDISDGSHLDRVGIDDVKESIQNCIDGISSTADKDWAFGSRLDQAPNPGLTLKRSGVVGLPLSHQEADRIRREAKYGDGLDKLPEVSCVLGPELFEFGNPAWPDYVQNLASKILATAAGPYEVRLVNMVLEDDTHTDLKPQTISTAEVSSYLKLSIFLPSLHSGGDIRCTMGDNSTSFSTASHSQFDLSYVASYSDVHQSSDPISAGNRLQLTYCVSPSSQMPMNTAKSLTKDVRDFEKDLHTWKRLRQDGNAPDLLAYVLDDQYSDESLEFSLLTAEDQLRAKFLQERCKQQGVRPFLSQLTGTVPCDYDYGWNRSRGNGEDKTTMELNNLVDLNGNVVWRGVADFLPRGIIQRDIYHARDSNDPERESDDPYAELVEYCYVDWVFVLIPEDYRLKFIVANSDGDVIRTWIDKLINTIRSDSKLSPSGDTTTELSYLVSEYTKSLQVRPSHSREYYGPPKDPQVQYKEDITMLIEASMLLGDQVLFRNALCKDPAAVNKDLYVRIGKEVTPANLELYTYGLEHLLMKFGNLHTRHHILQSILNGYASSENHTSDPELLDQWIFLQVETALAHLGTCGSDEACALMAIAERYGADFFMKRVVPSALSQAHTFDFIITFLERLGAAVEKGTIDKKTASTAVQTIVPSMTSTFASHLIRPSVKRQKLDSSTPSNNQTVPTKGPRMASVIDLCLHLNLEDESNRLLQSVIDKIPHSDAWWLGNILLPFLKSLAASLPHYYATPNNNTNTTHTNLFRSGLTLITTKYIGAPPLSPQTWSLPPRGCGRACKDCTEHLDPFLRSPGRQEWSFTSTGPRRKHLEERLWDEVSVRASTTMNARAPHVLVLRKTREGYEQAREAWRERRGVYEREVQGMGGDWLRGVLGEEGYGELVGFGVSQEQQHCERRALAPTQASAERSAMTEGKKAGVEVIDLEVY